MLDLSTAVLCDFAQVRDRLLFVSSGAVSRLYRAELPSPIGLMVGLIIEVPLEDAGMNHSLRAEVINRHGTVLATLDNVFRVGDEGLFPHEVQQVPLVLSITGVRARTWGTHQIRLYLDDELVRALTLYVVPAAGTQAVRPAQEAPAEPAPAPVAAPEPVLAPIMAPAPAAAPEPVGVRTDELVPESTPLLAPPATISADRAEADPPAPSWAPPSLGDDAAPEPEADEAAPSPWAPTSLTSEELDEVVEDADVEEETVARPFSFDTLRDELAGDDGATEADADGAPDDEAPSRFAFRYRDDES